MPKIDLTDKPIAITGASSGIGRAAALACARAGMPVGLFARRHDRLEDVRAEIERAGGRAVTYAGSVEDREACFGFVRHVEDAFGPIYGVFANAGYGFEKATWSLDESELRRIFEVNVWGSVHLANAALPGMLERRVGHLLFCSSCVSKIGLPFYGAYSATKAVQDHFARAMRHELRATGVYVSSVHPVTTSTEFFERAGERSGGRLRLQARSGPVQSPEKVADAVVRCLRTPRGEVWTSTGIRFMLAIATAFPGLTDRALDKRAERSGVRGGGLGDSPARPS